MRRKDREITDKSEIFEILSGFDTVRVGMRGEEYPYVVPVSFGFEVAGGKAILYFHCAKQGMKTELLRTYPRVCVEGDRFLGVQKTEHGITTRYESVIGFGECVFVEDEDEVKRALRLLLEHYGHAGYPLDRCKGIANLSICKITLDSVYGKKNLPEEINPAGRPSV